MKTPRKKASKKRRRTVEPTSGRRPADEPRCGLCGKAGKLTRTECCGNWICDDEDQYVLFSYARNSCHRNHRRFTLCGYHYTEEHDGHWKDCAQCREDIETEMYVYYGTNEYNFETLPNPPSHEPTKCAKCGKVIRLAYETHSYGPEGHLCARCGDLPPGLT